MMNGYIDRLENGRLKGWAFDPSEPNIPAKLQLRYAGKEVFTFYADDYREDLRDAGLGSGKCGFDIKIPYSILSKDESLLSVFSVKLKRNLANVRPLIDVRKQLSRISLQGHGIEIGALHNPLYLEPNVKVTYVDRLSLADLVKHYPDFDIKDVKSPDVIDDGEKLDTFADDSLDFIIASHMLEHCENPIGTIRSHLKKLRPGGALFYIIPDMRFFHDKNRIRTTFEHCVKDDLDGGKMSRIQHYLEWVRFWEFPNGVDSLEHEKLIQESAQKHLEEKYSIHFHVWDQASLYEFLQKTQDYLGGGFFIESYVFNYTEIIAVLRRSFS